MKLILPIRLTVLTAFCILTVTIITALSATNYIQSTGAARETAHEFITRAERTTSSNTQKLLGSARLLASSIASAPMSPAIIANPSVLTAFLHRAMAEVPEVYSAYIAFESGRFIQAINLVASDGTRRTIANAPIEAIAATRIIDTVPLSGKRLQEWTFYDVMGTEIADTRTAVISEYDPRVRPWYTRALETKTLGASDIYVFSSLQKPGVTISAPMRNLRSAVVGLDIPLESLAKFVEEQRPGTNGVIAIVDSNQTMVAHPDPAKIIARSRDGTTFETVQLENVTDERLRAAARELATSPVGQAEIVVRQARFFVSSLPVNAFPGDQWQIISLAAVDDFTGPVVRSIEISAIIAAILLIISIGVVVLIANWLATPLIESSVFAERISELELDAPAPASSPLFEIQKLGHSMAAMRNALRMFLRYAPRDLVRDLVVSGKTAEIGGSRQEVTIMFTDIEGFTEMTENQSPEEVLIQTSSYFEAVTKALEPYRTTIDKFIGDAIMAMWNAPIEDPEHIDHACYGMLAARQASEDLNAKLSAKGGAPMRTRFGLHTGEALVGNVGSPRRMQFTSLGPVVNLASRIEGLNKYYGTQLLVSGAVQEKASDDFVFRKVDIVEAVGTSIPVTIYELLGVKDRTSPFAVSDTELAFKESFERALELFLAREFAMALGMFEELCAQRPADISCRSFIERCNRFKSNPPGDD